MQQTACMKMDAILEEGEFDNLKSQRRYVRHKVDDLVIYITQLYESGKVPCSMNFFPVRCKDFSCGGIAFWFPTRPNFKNLVVRLGDQSHPIYVEVEVVHASPVKEPPEKKVIRDSDGVEHKITLGPRLFQVGCRFLGRIPATTS